MNDDNSDKGQLRREIIALSLADSWEEAKREWGLSHVEYRDEGYCLCGKRIKERCYITNRKNNNTTHVGNECIKHFDGAIAHAEHTKEIFKLVKKIDKSVYHHPGVRAVATAYAAGCLSLADIQFLAGKEKRRHLSPSQMRWMRDINNRIIRGLMANPDKYIPDRRKT